MHASRQTQRQATETSSGRHIITARAHANAEHAADPPAAPLRARATVNPQMTWDCESCGFTNADLLPVCEQCGKLFNRPKYTMELTGTKYSSLPGRDGWFHSPDSGKAGTRHGPPALYVVRVMAASGREWQLEKSFTDFMQLRDELKAQGIAMTDARFPRKRHMGHENEEKNVKVQAEQFATFISKVLAPHVTTHPLIASFMELERDGHHSGAPTQWEVLGKTTCNWRDVGSMAGQTHMFYRSSEVYSNEDTSRVKTIIDLRRDKDIKGGEVCLDESSKRWMSQEADTFTPEHLTRVNINFVPTNPTGLKLVGSIPKLEAVANISSSDREVKMQYSLYRAIGFGGLNEVMLDNSQPQILEALKLFAVRSNYPILVHCIHGKDRTGYETFLLVSSHA